MKEHFCGPLASAIERHLQLRRSLGFAYEHSSYTLAAFDRFLTEHFPETKTVTRQIIIAYLEVTRDSAPCTRAHRLSDLRQFCRFVFQLDPNTYIPEPNLLPPAKVIRRPHIYTLEEVIAIVRLAKQLRPAGSLRPWTYATLISLLWVTGLRIGEALRLKLQDVDLAQGLLLIERTKNYKSRLVPLTASTTCALTDYRERRSRYGHDQRAEAAFFVNELGRRYASRTVEGTFLVMIRQLGLKSAQGMDPCFHDFRHSFATRSLAAFYHAGQEPTTYLPVLATYLGHTNLTDTAVYLHPQPDVLETAGQRFRARVRAVGNLTIGGQHGEL
jgi:integrase/recombinase XerD